MCHINNSRTLDANHTLKNQTKKRKWNTTSQMIELQNMQKKKPQKKSFKEWNFFKMQKNV
jgi:hypothetical protein